MSTTETADVTAWYAPIVTVSPTIIDGQVVRWYRTVAAAEMGLAPTLSASRNAVIVDSTCSTVNDTKRLGVQMSMAAEVKEALAYNNDMKHLATHEWDFERKTLSPVGGQEAVDHACCKRHVPGPVFTTFAGDPPPEFMCPECGARWLWDDDEAEGGAWYWDPENDRAGVADD